MYIFKCFYVILCIITFFTCLKDACIQNVAFHDVRLYDDALLNDATMHDAVLHCILYGIHYNSCILYFLHLVWYTLQLLDAQ